MAAVLAEGRRTGHLKFDDRRISADFMMAIGQGRQVDDAIGEVARFMQPTAERGSQPDVDYRSILQGIFYKQGLHRTGCAKIRELNGLQSKGSVVHCPHAKNVDCLRAGGLLPQQQLQPSAKAPTLLWTPGQFTRLKLCQTLGLDW
jgi:hypothetical protein